MLLRLLCATTALWVGSTQLVFAEPLADLVGDAVRHSKTLQAAAGDLESARQSAKAAWGGWYPELTVSASSGYEKVGKPDAADTSLAAKELDITVNQLIYDFGRTDALIGQARLRQEQASVAIDATRQNVLLEAAAAYANLVRASEALSYARKSEENIRRQTGLEESRIELGGGYSTDVLQAKTQLAGATARRTRAEMALEVAANRFRNVFNRTPERLSTFSMPRYPAQRIPQAVEQAVEIAKNANPTLKNAALQSQIAREQSKFERAKGFFPRAELIAEHKSKQDVAGTAGYRQEDGIKAQISMPFNLGMTAVNTLRAAQYASGATELRQVDTAENVEEVIRNAWQNLNNAKATALALRNQANLANEFLELARKERKLGTRSLLDVLNGETVYFNAQADAVSAEADVVIAAYTLLNAMGQLNEDAITQANAETAQVIAYQSYAEQRGARRR